MWVGALQRMTSGLGPKTVRELGGPVNRGTDTIHTEIGRGRASGRGPNRSRETGDQHDLRGLWGHSDRGK